MVSIYVGNLPWSTTTEDFGELFTEYSYNSAEVVFGRNGRSRGYGLVEFATQEDADNAINNLNETEVDGRKIFLREETKRPNKVDNRNTNRGGGGGGGGGGNSGGVERGEPNPGVLYVGNLPWSVQTEDLESLFSSYNFSSAEVIFDRNGRSRGFGIVGFESPEEAESALNNLNESEVDGRKIFIREDRGPPKKQTYNNSYESNNYEQDYSGGGGGGGRNYDNGEEDANFTGTSVYVGNLSWNIEWQELKEAFQDFNPSFADVKRDRSGNSRGWGTVKFEDADTANQVIEEMDGIELDGRQIKLRVDKRA